MSEQQAPVRTVILFGMWPRCPKCGAEPAWVNRYAVTDNMGRAVEYGIQCGCVQDHRWKPRKEGTP